jgi:sigma-B regulation protein RsbU (phosphoserine phosphatase)
VSASVRTSPGDSLVIYTDGISESEGPDGAQYGSASLEKLLHTCRQLPSRELVDACLKEVFNFRSGSPRLDDQALMVLQFAPAA